MNGGMKGIAVGILLSVTATAATQAEAATTPAHVDRTANNVPISYPDVLQDKGIAGTTVLSVEVSSSGKPIRLRFVRSSGNEDLDIAAANGVMNWHYIPAMDDGDPVTDWAEVDVVFKLPAPPPPAPKAAP